MNKANKIQEILKGKEHKSFVFKPDAEFYQSVGIANRRWAKIYRGQIVPTLTEAKAIAEYFEIPVTDLID